MLGTFSTHQGFCLRLSAHHKHRSVLCYKQKARLPLCSHQVIKTERTAHKHPVTWHTTKFATPCSNTCSWREWESEESTSLVRKEKNRAEELQSPKNTKEQRFSFQEYKDSVIALEILYIYVHLLWMQDYWAPALSHVTRETRAPVKLCRSSTINLQHPSTLPTESFDHPGQLLMASDGRKKTLLPSERLAGESICQSSQNPQEGWH